MMGEVLERVLFLRNETDIQLPTCCGQPTWASLENQQVQGMGNRWALDIYCPSRCLSFSRTSRSSEISPLEEVLEFGVCIMGNNGEDTGSEPRKQLGQMGPT